MPHQKDHDLVCCWTYPSVIWYSPMNFRVNLIALPLPIVGVTLRISCSPASNSNILLFLPAYNLCLFCDACIHSWIKLTFNVVDCSNSIQYPPIRNPDTHTTAFCLSYHLMPLMVPLRPLLILHLNGLTL